MQDDIAGSEESDDYLEPDQTLELNGEGEKNHKKGGGGLF